MATDSIQRIHAAIEASGIPVRTAGPVIVTRPIAGTNRPSQHSFGNAEDWYPSDPGEADRAQRKEKVPSLELLFQFLSKAKADGSLPIATLCYYNRGGCTTDHRDHLHVDGDPPVDRVTNDPKPVGAATGGAYQRIGDSISGGIEGGTGIFGTIGNIGDFIGLLTTGELWVRAAYIGGGFLAIGGGIYFIAKEFGAPSFTQVAGAVAGAKIPG